MSARLLLALAVAFAALLAGAASANAAIGYGHLGSFSTYGSADGEMINPERVAVDAATGNVLVADSGNDRVQVFSPTATAADYLTQFGAGTLDRPVGLAIDQSTGDVYVADAGNNRIVRFTTDRAPTPTYTLDAGYTSPAQGAGAGQVGSFASPIAIEQSSGDLWIADTGNQRVARFNRDGSYDNVAFDGADSPDGIFVDLLDLAVDSTGDVIVVHSLDPLGSYPYAGTRARVDRFGSAGEWEARIGAPNAFAGTVTTNASDQVLVSGNQISYVSGANLTVQLFAPDGTPLATATIPGGDDGPGPGGSQGGSAGVYSVMSGIATGPGSTGRLYAVTDIADDGAFGPYGRVSVQAFEALLPVPPVVDTPPASAADIAATTVTLNATIDNANSAGSFHFEYGPTGTGLASRTAEFALGARVGPQVVTAQVRGLSPSTGYEFRVVADNEGGQTIGSVQTFTTALPPPAVTVLDASGVTTQSATLHATVDAFAVPGTTYTISVVEVDGTDSRALGRWDLPTGSGPVPVSASVDALSPGSVYRVSVSAFNSAGIATASREFTTAPSPGYVPRERPGTDSTPYGCVQPRLDAAGRSVRAGQTITLTGADLGVGGAVRFATRSAAVTGYAHDRVTAIVPSGVSGRVDVVVDCGRRSNAIVVNVVPPPSNSVSVGRPTVRGTVATLRVQVGSRGTVTVTGGRRLGRATKRSSRRTTVTVRVRLSRAGARALRNARSRRLTVTASVRFAPTGGTPRTVKVPLTFRR